MLYVKEKKSQYIVLAHSLHIIKAGLTYKEKKIKNISKKGIVGMFLAVIYIRYILFARSMPTIRNL